MQLVEEAGRPWETIWVDFIGPYGTNKTEKKNCCAFVVVDDFSRWMEAGEQQDEWIPGSRLNCSEEIKAYEDRQGTAAIRVRGGQMEEVLINSTQNEPAWVKE